MKKYCLTYMAAVAALSASAAAPQAERKTDSLHIASLSPREAATIDSIVAMRLRLQPKQIESIFDTNDVVAIDTLDSGNDAIQVVLYSNNTWKYVRNREIAKDSTIFEKYWDTTTLFPYKEVDMSSMPKSVVIDLVDSVTSYHCPYQGSVHRAQIRPAPPAPASGRRPAAQGGRPGLRHVLRPRAYFGI